MMAIVEPKKAATFVSCGFVLAVSALLAHCHLIHLHEDLSYRPLSYYPWFVFFRLKKYRSGRENNLHSTK
jgi:hypothetical protein